MKNYLEAKKIWDEMSPESRRKLLKQHGRDSILSCRSFPYLPREVRADIQPSLVKQSQQNKPAAAKPARHYWYQEI